MEMRLDCRDEVGLLTELFIEKGASFQEHDRALSRAQVVCNSGADRGRSRCCQR